MDAVTRPIKQLILEMGLLILEPPFYSPRNKSREKLGIQAFGILKHYYRGKGCGRLGRNEKRFHVASDSE
jgi:hypothetical protein